MRNAGTTAAPLPGHRLPKCKMLLWLALPFTLGVGCAFGPGSSAVADEFFTDFPAPVVAAVSARQAANVVVGNEIFYMFLADTSTDCSLTAMVDKGVVTLGGVSFVGVERQSIIDQTWELAGVNQVQNELGVDLVPTPAKVVAVR